MAIKPKLFCDSWLRAVGLNQAYRDVAKDNASIDAVAQYESCWNGGGGGSAVRSIFSILSREVRLSVTSIPKDQEADVHTAKCQPTRLALKHLQSVYRFPVKFHRRYAFARGPTS